MEPKSTAGDVDLDWKFDGNVGFQEFVVVGNDSPFGIRDLLENIHSTVFIVPSTLPTFIASRSLVRQSLSNCLRLGDSFAST